MEIEYSEGTIKFNKEIGNLDKFVIDFTKILLDLRIDYVLISGYVAILFGRNRESEDIDLFIEKLTYEKFKSLWQSLQEEFECITTFDMKDAYENYLNTKHAIRFSYKGKFIPNIEVKFPKIELDDWTLKNKLNVYLNGNLLLVSKIELQIAYKLFLSSEEGDKDMEDAKFLYVLFSDKLDKELLIQFNKRLNIQDKFIKYIEK